LTDIAPHPKFAQNHLVYFTHNKAGERGATPALGRGTFDGNRLIGITDVFVADAWAKIDNHSSRIAFAPDGTLYMSVSERNDELGAQNPNSHMGKLLRLREDGTAPPDNPFVGRAGYRPEIFTIGHRNFHGTVVHPETGEAWTMEHGDEVNVHRRGANHGWPYVGVGGEGGGTPIGNPPAGLKLTAPFIALNPAVGVQGMTFYTGNKFPEWRGDLFIGGGRTMGISRFEIGKDGATSREDLFTQFNRIRDVRMGPDGLIYFILDGAPGGVMRIEPAE
jgi:aldose sugar dehydrogenase